MKGESEEVWQVMSPSPLMILGGADGDRTHDLMNAIHALSQLSYSPTGSLIDLKITQPKICCQIELKFPPFLRWERIEVKVEGNLA